MGRRLFLPRRVVGLVRIPPIAPAEEILDRELLHIGIAELAGPRNTSCAVGPLTAGSVLGEVRGLFAMRFPVMPAFGPDRGVHFRVDKNGPAVIPPRPREVDAVLRVLARQG